MVGRTPITHTATSVSIMENVGQLNTPIIRFLGGTGLILAAPEARHPRVYIVVATLFYAIVLTGAVAYFLFPRSNTGWALSALCF